MNIALEGGKLFWHVKTSDGDDIILKWKVEVVEEESEYLEKVNYYLQMQEVGE